MKATNLLVMLMDNQFVNGTPVELLPGREEVYQRALAGSRGVIRASKVDDYGYEKVYIEWDKDHWRYNGEPNGWTYASHFQVAEDIDPHATDLVNGDIDIPLTPPVPSSREEREAQINDYVESMMDAFDRASESDGFYLVTVRRGIDPESGQEIVLIEMHRGAVDEEMEGIHHADLFHFVEQEMRRRDQ